MTPRRITAAPSLALDTMFVAVRIAAFWAVMSVSMAPTSLRTCSSRTATRSSAPSRTKSLWHWLILMQSNPQLTKSFGQVIARAPQMRILNAAGNVQYTTDPKYKDRSNDIIIAKRNGEEVIIQMEDANLAGAFNGKNVWNAGHANAILRGLSKLNRYLSNIVTSWNPEFVFTNFFRDIQGAGINISEFDLPGLRRDVVKNIPSALAGLRAAIRDENFSSPWSQRYREFALAGGQSAANPMNTLQDQVDQINDILNDFGKGGSLAQLRKSGGRVLQVP
jgi:hypothetical protein